MTKFVHRRGHISVLQQRILFAESRFEQPAYLVENFPEWPSQAFEEATRDLNPESVGRYLPSRGADALVAQIVAHEQEKYGIALAEESVLVTAGGMHALWLAFRDIARRRPGSTVLCLGIAFVGVANLIAMAGMKARFIDCDPTELMAEEVERHLTIDVSCLYINSPHNPSGEYLDARQMKEISQLLQDWSLHAVIDAVYDSYFFDGGRPTVPTQIGMADHLYFVCSMSKNFGLPGARIGWLISSRSNIEAAMAWLENENVSVSSISQELATRVLSLGNGPLLGSMTSVRAGTLKFLAREFDLDRIPPAGTQMALKLPVDDVEQFADYALNEHELVLATSSNYAGFQTEFIRLPFSYLWEHTAPALDRLALAIHTYAHQFAAPARRVGYSII